MAAGPVHGLDLDAEGRCRHWHGPTDIVAIRFRCCGLYFACHACHEAMADHVATRWHPAEFDQPAVMCGACRAELSVRHYLDGDDRCPACHAAFNPRCRLHHPLYFEM
ncbi:MAG: CHY zinc finger protein [Longimicrobiales bacterium]